MAKVFQKMKDFLGWNDDEEEYYDEAEDVEDEEDEESTPVREVQSRQRKAYASNGNIVNLHGKMDFSSKLIVYRPVSYDDARNIIDNLKKRRPVIVNMEGIDREIAQRILDFVYGAICAVDGKLYKVNGRIFVVSPANCDVVGGNAGY